MINTQDKIASVCERIKQLLLDKNKKYGDSAINPIRVFSSANAKEQILVRIDDKLSRIARGAGINGLDEDVINDLIGYLVLLKIAVSDEESKWDGSDIEPSYKYDGCSYFGNTIPVFGAEGEDVISFQAIYSEGDKFG